MQGIYLIIFETFIIILYGIFVRISSTDTVLTTYFSAIPSGFYFIFAYSVMSFKYRMFDWSVLTNMLFVLIISLQLNTLYTMFWMNCFDGFNATTDFNGGYVVIALQATLAILITSYEFIGQISKAQLFLICMVQVFAFALNWVIQYKGITSMTGGSVMTSFLFGYVFSIPIRKLKFNTTPFAQQKQKYFTLTLKFIGLVLLIFLWPSWNFVTSIPDLSIVNINPSSQILQSAYLQTFLGLLSAVITTLAVRIYGQKIMINQFINSILNTGILIGSSSSVIIDPFASILLGVIGPIVYLLYEKYLQSILFQGYPLDKVIICLLSAILNSIFVAGRSGRVPTLATNYSQQAGYQFVNFILSGLFALVFGILAGFLLKSLNSLNQQTSNKDSTFWMLQQQIMPLYSDDPLLNTFYQKQKQKKLKKQQDAFNLKHNFIADKVRQNTQLGKILKQQIQYESRIKK